MKNQYDRDGNVTPFRRESDWTTCTRCGADVRKSHHAEPKGPTGICQDCRSGDPEYVQLLAMTTPPSGIPRRTTTLLGNPRPEPRVDTTSWTGKNSHKRRNRRRQEAS